MQQWIGLEGYTYANFMRRCVAPELQQGICVKGEYGWDGWLGCYFANFPKENMTILMMIPTAITTKILLTMILMITVMMKNRYYLQ